MNTEQLTDLVLRHQLFNLEGDGYVYPPARETPLEDIIEFFEGLPQPPGEPLEEIALPPRPTWTPRPLRWTYEEMLAAEREGRTL